jgi:hypothetical protein
MQRQLLTLSGLAAVIVLVVAFGIGGDTPGSGDAAASVKAFYVDHGSAQRAGAFLIMIAVPLLVFFATAVRSVLVENGDAATRIWANIFFAGAAIASSGLLLGASLGFALASSPEDLSGSSIQALNAFSEETWPAFTAGIGVLLLGAAGAMIPLPTGLRWLGWAALVLGIVTFTPLGFIGFVGAGLWIVLTSVAIAMRLRTPQTTPRAPLAIS